MFLDIIIIVLQRTLEASVLISLLLSISRTLNFDVMWIIPGIIIGVFGAVIYATNLGHISDWFNYVGQELVNASLNLAIFTFLALIAASLERISVTKKSYFKLLLSGVVALTLTIEGGKLLIFYMGYVQNSEMILRALTSGAIGSLIGISVGILFYYLLVSISTYHAHWPCTLMLYLIAAGIALRTTQLLIQANWFLSAEPVWDTSQLLAEDSMIGQLVHAVFTYEATPSLIELASYILAIALIFSLRYWAKITVYPNK